MTAEDIIREVQQETAEWLEMTQYPSDFLVGVLATKILKMKEHIQYLEKRLENARP